MVAQHQAYLDNAATTALDPEVANAMSEVLTTAYGNPSSTHGYGRKAKAILEKSRKYIGTCIGAQASEIFFTSGGTEANNWIIRSAVQDLGVELIITTRIEHHAVLYPVEYMAERYGCQVHYLEINQRGQISTNELHQVLSEHSDKSILVSLMHCNNEIGTLLDLDEVGAICKSHDKVLFHTDTVQSVGKYDFNLKELPVDFLVASAHKFHGPKGIGFAYCRKGSGIKPYILGGGQERGGRAGTESIHNIVGMEKALENSYAHLSEDREYIKSLKQKFCRDLEAAFDTIYFVADSNQEGHCTYTLVNVGFPEISEKVGEMLMFQLDMQGIYCSKGSACQSGSQLGSHVIKEVIPEKYKTIPTIRFSFSKYTTVADLEYTVQVLRKVIS